MVIMTDEIRKLREWSLVLHQVAKDYPHRTIENIIDNINSRIKELNK